MLLLWMWSTNKRTGYTEGVGLDLFFFCSLIAYKFFLFVLINRSIVWVWVTLNTLFAWFTVFDESGRRRIRSFQPEKSNRFLNKLKGSYQSGRSSVTRAVACFSDALNGDNHFVCITSWLYSCVIVHLKEILFHS